MSALDMFRKAVNTWNGYAEDSGAKVWALEPGPNWPGSAFCGKGRSRLLYQAGMGPAPLKDWDMYPYVPNEVNGVQAAGRRITSYQSQEGDGVYFDWAFSGVRDGVADHVGTIISNNPALPYVHTFEFNTLPDSGPQIRGAYFKRRMRADILCCGNYQPEFAAGVGPTPAPAPKLPTSNAQDLNKWLDKTHIEDLQKVLGVSVDGVVGPDTTKALQGKLGTPKDGVLTAGFSTAVKVMQQLVGVKPDGVLGPDTGKALSAYLDKGNTFGHATPVKKTTPFPLAAGNAYAMNDGTNYTHSGIRGNDHTVVMRIQSLVGVKADGVYGRLTRAAVIQFQQKHGLTADGQVGPATWAKMGL